MITQNKIPIHIISGFLGAGKTSFLSQLLQLDQMANSAIIINEFGEFSLDHLLIDHVEDDIYKLANGCLCCANNNQLTDKLLEISRQSLQVPLDRIIIETSGVADTENLIASLWNNSDVREQFILAGTIVIISAIDWKPEQSQPQEAEIQIATADHILVSKLDVLSPTSRNTELSRLVSSIELFNSTAEIRQIPLNTEEILRVFSTESKIRQSKPARPHKISNYQSCDCAWDKPVSTKTIASLIETMLVHFGDDILRIKGTGLVVEHPNQPLVIQVAGNNLTPFSQLNNWSDIPATRLTIIHKGHDNDPYRDLFYSFFSRPDIDQPDRSALTDNPLSIPGMGKF